MIGFFFLVLVSGGQPGYQSLRKEKEKRCVHYSRSGQATIENRTSMGSWYGLLLAKLYIDNAHHQADLSSRRIYNTRGILIPIDVYDNSVLR
jgi:hypothetical protein